jgi:RNA polymerase sigma-70 factor (ECF subfamily)
MRIVINATLMRMRQRGRRVMFSVDGEPSNGDESPLMHPLLDMAPDPEAAYAVREAFELVRRRLHTLPPACQDVLWFRAVWVFSTKEAASALGVSAGTIKSALHRARAKLAGLASRTTVQQFRQLTPAGNAVSKARRRGKDAAQRNVA